MQRLSLLPSASRAPVLIFFLFEKREGEKGEGVSFFSFLLLLQLFNPAQPPPNNKNSFSHSPPQESPPPARAPARAPAHPPAPGTPTPQGRCSRCTPRSAPRGPAAAPGSLSDAAPRSKSGRGGRLARGSGARAPRRSTCPGTARGRQRRSRGTGPGDFFFFFFLKEKKKKKKKKKKREVVRKKKKRRLTKNEKTKN